jgi:hypothetical protein
VRVSIVGDLVNLTMPRGNLPSEGLSSARYASLPKVDIQSNAARVHYVDMYDATAGVDVVPRAPYARLPSAVVVATTND